MAKVADNGPFNELWAEYRRNRDPKLRDRLIEAYLPVVRIIAERMKERLPASVQLEELVQDGALGLLEAIDRYDPAMGVKFQTYCTQRVQGSICDWLRRRDHVSRQARQKVNRLARAEEQLQMALGRPPSEEELAVKMGTSVGAVREVLKDMSACMLYSMQKVSDKDEGEVGIESIPDSREGPWAAAEKRDLVDFVLRCLEPRERQILVMYYQEGLIMSEIAEVLGMSESRVSQYHSRILLKLRGRIGVIARGKEGILRRGGLGPAAAAA